MSSYILELPFSYLLWHYSAALVDLWRIFTNLLWFLWNFFSIRILFSTLFSPWKRLHEGRERGNAGFLGRLILNCITRVVGLLIRAVTIIMGLCALILAVVLFAVCLVLWLLLPVIAFFLFINGVTGLIVKI